MGIYQQFSHEIFILAFPQNGNVLQHLTVVVKHKLHEHHGMKATEAFRTMGDVPVPHSFSLSSALVTGSTSKILVTMSFHLVGILLWLP